MGNYLYGRTQPAIKPATQPATQTSSQTATQTSSQTVPSSIIEKHLPGRKLTTTIGSITITGAPAADNGTSKTITLGLSDMDGWSESQFDLQVNTTNKTITIVNTDTDSPSFTYDSNTFYATVVNFGGGESSSGVITYSSPPCDDNYVQIFFTNVEFSYQLNIHLYFMVPAQSTNAIICNAICILRLDGSMITNPFINWAANHFKACDTN